MVNEIRHVRAVDISCEQPKLYLWNSAIFVLTWNINSHHYEHYFSLIPTSYELPKYSWFITFIHAADRFS